MYSFQIQISAFQFKRVVMLLGSVNASQQDDLSEKRVNKTFKKRLLSLNDSHLNLPFLVSWSVVLKPRKILAYVVCLLFHRIVSFLDTPDSTSTWKHSIVKSIQFENSQLNSQR